MSSTLSDWEEERDALQKRVFPSLHELCAEHGHRFQVIDPRWAIREEAALDQRTMRIRLEEAARFRDSVPRPNFVVLLGDRYGWCPLPYEIPASEFDQILSHTSDVDAVRLLTHWYRRDDNAVPAVYDLQPRTGTFIDPANWSRVERGIRSVLPEATRDLQLEPDQRLKYVASATEQEIVHGALRTGDATQHVFCFFRTIQNLPRDRSAAQFTDVGDDGVPDRTSQTRMAELKTRLRRILPDTVREYTTNWTGSGISAVHIDQLCEDAHAFLSHIILDEIARLRDADRLPDGVESHDAARRHCPRFFVGRTSALVTVADYIRGTDFHPLVISGAAGSGKTALMAKAVDQLRDTHPVANVIVRFIGATPDASDGRALLHGLCHELNPARDRDGPIRHRRSEMGDTDGEEREDRRSIEEPHSPPGTFAELSATFRSSLSLVPADTTLILFLDALDQLAHTDQARHLTWLPTELPTHVRLIVSTAHGDTLSTLKKRLREASVVELEPMQSAEGEQLLGLWLKDAGRRLEPRQWNEVVERFSHYGLPLYLTLAFEEARRWKSYTEKTHLGADIPGVIRNVLARLSRDANHGRVMLSRALQYLGSSRNGLTDEELLALLSHDKKVWDDVGRHSHYLPPGEILPPAVWSRLSLDLDPYLTERPADGTTLLTFRHRQCADLVAQALFGENSKRERHRSLAIHFNAQPLWKETCGTRIPNRRKLSELPYQQTCAAMWDELEGTLCDFSFIEAKCAAGEAYALADDYSLAVRLMPDDGANGRRRLRIEGFAKFVRTRSDLFAANPSQVFPQAANEPDITGPAAAAKQSWENGIERRPWLRWVNKPLQESPCILTIAAAPGDISACSYSPDGRRIVSASDRLAVWDAESGSELWHVDAVRAESCAWSPDGRHIAAACKDALRVWDAETSEPIQTMAVHSKSCEYSPDGQRLLSTSDDKTVRVWDAKTGECLRTLTHGEYVSACAYSPDGLQIASVDRNGILRLWNAETGEVTRTLEGAGESIVYSADGRRIIAYGWMTLKVWDVNTGEELRVFEQIADRVVRACAYSPDGSRIAGACSDDTLGIWDASTGERLRVLVGHTGDITACTYSRDGGLIVSASEDRTVRVWDTPTGACALVLEGHSGRVTACSLSADGRRVVSASNDKTLRVWEIDSRKESRVLQGHSQAVHACTFSADGRRIVSVSSDHSLKVWDSRTGECIQTLTGVVGSPCSCSPDGRWILTGGDDCTIQLWDVNSGEMVRVLRGHSKWINACTYSPDGRRIATASADGTLKIWDAQTFSDLRTLCGHSSRVQACAFSPDGERLVSTAEDGTLRLWDVETGTELRVLSGKAYHVKSCCCSPDGRLVAFGCSDSVVRVCDTRTGRDVRRLHGHWDRGWGGGVSACAFSRDGRHLLSGSSDGTLRVWDLEAAGSLTVPSDDQAGSRACAYSPDGNQIVAACGSRVEIRDGESGEVRRTVGGHSGDVRACVCSPDGSLILSASHDRTLRVWDAESGRSLRWLVGHRYEVDGCAYSPDGRWVVSASNDSTLNIWDAATGEALMTLDGHWGSVHDCAYSPDGRSILSASLDHTLKLWDAESAVELRTLAGHSDSVESCAYAPDGRHAASTSGDGTLKIWTARTGGELQTERSGGSVVFTPDGNRIITASWRDRTVRVRDVDTGECLAMLVCDAPVAGAVTGKGGRAIACGDRRRGVRVFRLLGLDPGIPIATVVRLYLPDRSYESAPGIRCSWCGRRSPAPPAILDCIAGITHDARVGPDDAPCLTLPFEAWDEPRLIGVCPLCQGPLKYNPFVVDNRERTERTLGQWKRIGQGRKRLVFLRQEADARRESGNLDGAAVLHKDNERFCRETGDRQGLWQSLKEQADIFMDQGNYDHAMAAISEAEQLCRELGTPEGVAICLANHAIICLKRQQLTEAERLAAEAHLVAAGATCTGLHKEVLVVVQDRVGDAFRAQSDYPRAIEAYQRGVWAVEHLIVGGSSSEFGRGATDLLQKKIEHAHLMETDPDAALDRLIGMLADSEQQGWAINMLSQVGEPAAERLIVALGSPEQAGGAACALHRMTEPPIGRLLEALGDPVRRPSAIYALSKIGGPAVEPLIAALGDPVRQPSATYVLSEIGGPAVEPLIAALGDPVRRPSAIYALSKIGGPAVEPLIAALADPGKRAGAASALSEIGQGAVDALTAVLDDEDKGPWARAALSMIRGE